MIVKGEAIYCTGVVRDTMAPNHTINTFAKYKADGTLLYNKIFKGDSVTTEVGTFENALITTHDGGFALTGYNIDHNTIRCLLIKYDSTGNVILYKKYTDTLSQTFFGKRIVEADDGGFFIQGTIQYQNFLINLFVLKVDSSGNPEWEKYYGNANTYSSAFLKTSSGRLLIVGSKDNGQCTNYSACTSYACFLLIDTAGGIIKTAYGTDPKLSAGVSIKETSDGNFVYCTSYITGVQGGVTSDGYLFKGYVAKVDTNLHLVWEKKYGTMSEVTGFDEVKQLPGGGYVLSGSIYDTSFDHSHAYHQNGWLMKLDANGDSIWSRQYRGVTRIGQQIETNILHNLDILNNGSIIACGVAEDDNDTFPQQAWLLRVDSNGCLNDSFCGYFTGIEERGQSLNSSILKVYPNPAANAVTIQLPDEWVKEKAEIKLLDVTGRVLMAASSLYRQKATIPVQQFPPGIYIICVTCNGITASGRVVKE